ncbi:hypothetical protein Q8A64_06880 [Oxalobacteraceae bacterium R-40]|uniref:Uncharacterized protein n=1 Tax=Keguizhuia sedimenti TaxID=3064264 RepID=A0ABU1BMC6_9BURK|nr:hypothetical protein [Oxalobacteraceae bacterium R-40]
MLLTSVIHIPFAGNPGASSPDSGGLALGNACKKAALFPAAKSVPIKCPFLISRISIVFPVLNDDGSKMAGTQACLALPLIDVLWRSATF